jgi:hypothetical protein
MEALSSTINAQASGGWTLHSIEPTRSSEESAKANRGRSSGRLSQGVTPGSGRQNFLRPLFFAGRRYQRVPRIFGGIAAPSLSAYANSAGVGHKVWTRRGATPAPRQLSVPLRDQAISARTPRSGSGL